MNCESVQEGLMDWLANELPATEAQALEAHLKQCPDCQREQAAVWQMWQAMGQAQVPAPSEQMRPRFYSMLAEFQAAEQRRQRWSLTHLLQQVREWWQPQYAMRLAYSLVLLIVGLGAGYALWGRNSATEQPQLAAVEQPEAGQVPQALTRQAKLLAQLENPSAVQRLQAVSSAEELAPANERVVTALLSTLNSDPNVNVRLATLEVLAGLGDDPIVRQGLVRSLQKQDSPLVQSALADVMVQLQERRSVRPLRRLLEQDNLNEQVKSKIEQSIQSLSTGQPTQPATPPTYNETHDDIPAASAPVVAA